MRLSDQKDIEISERCEQALARLAEQYFEGM